MAARSGRQFLERLAAARVHVEIQGETLTGGVASHPAFRNVVRSYAALFDMQHDPACRDVLTYPSPSTGEPVATSFLIPRTAADLERRRRAFKLWADRSFGMLGRTGDYLNSALMGLASAAGWFGQADAAFARNVVAYYEKVREEDLLCTHTLIPPQANRAVSGSQQAGGTLMAHVVREDDNGIVVRGASEATANANEYGLSSSVPRKTVDGKTSSSSANGPMVASIRAPLMTMPSSSSLVT